MLSRRDLLRLGVVAGAHPAAIARALAIPPASRFGSLTDVQHVVILMQENRSFDHYFGAFRGVRGFGDPRPMSLPGGRPVWAQAAKVAGNSPVFPFRLDATATRAESMTSLDHSWKGSHERWKHHDAWIDVKGPMTMGHFERADIPFYYALADAFTVCDAYHCSLFGPTHPNRLFMWSGTSGLSVGRDRVQAIENDGDDNQGRPDPSRDDLWFSGYDWTTYPERLEAAGVSWKIYQEYDNYGCNLLVNFAAYRGKDANPALIHKARSWAPGSGPADVAWLEGPAPHDRTRGSNGNRLIAEIARDVANNRLPSVSWIVPPTRVCEHPSMRPSDGEDFVARLLDALTANPEVWGKTALILTYDENDGFFDHVPPPLPAVAGALGASTVSTEGETYHGVPVGLGCRVPTIVISPWTKGGWINSQVFDHTSIIRFLEARFGVHEPNITSWRRAVCGDLTSAFDFTGRDEMAPKLLPTGGLVARAQAASTLPDPVVPASPSRLVQEPGQRSARALPYDLQVHGRVDRERSELLLELINVGAAGAAFNAYAPLSDKGPWFYTVEAGQRLVAQIPTDDGAYDLRIFGPNGFLREFAGHTIHSQLEVVIEHRPALRRVLVTLNNAGSAPVRADLRPNAYGGPPRRSVELAPGQSSRLNWSTAADANWYDFTVTASHDPAFMRRFAGHMEDGRPSLTDPAIGTSKTTRS